MRLLLDTHAFLWWIAADDRLSAEASNAIADGSNDVIVSAAVGWEIAVKWALGRLDLPGPPGEVVPDQLERNAFEVLPVHLRHVLSLPELPDLHADPFDRILVAQALVDDLTLVTADETVRSYPVPVLW